MSEIGEGKEDQIQRSEIREALFLEMAEIDNTFNNFDDNDKFIFLLAKL